MSKKSHIIIIGASHAGVAAAEQLRKNGCDKTITIIDREKTMPMERPPLSKAWLSGNDHSPILLRQAAWFKEYNIDFWPNTEVVAIEPKTKTITTNDGAIIEWQQLIIATGARPRPLHIEAKSPKIHVLRVPEDATRLSGTMETASSIAIIGGGYIGLEVAASATKRGLKATVIEMAPRLLARVASIELSGYIQKCHEAAGVTIKTGTAIDDIVAEGGALILKTPNEAIKTDSVLVGIGVLPDSGLGIGAGLEVDNGFVVSEEYQTNQPDIWAVGDVARCRGGYAKGMMRIESVHHAQMSAEIAAASIMGKTPKPHEVPWFWSDQYDKKLQSAGFVPPEAITCTRLGRREGAVSFWSFNKAGELAAIEAVNDPQAYMIGKTVIGNQTPVTQSQISDSAFDLKSLMKG